jgi:hypothetical protein
MSCGRIVIVKYSNDNILLKAKGKTLKRDSVSVLMSMSLREEICERCV